MSDDVWSPGGDEGRPAAARPTGTAYGSGLWINQAFSLDVAFRLGLALFRERPGLLLALGAALWLFSNLPSFLSMPGDFTTGFLEEIGETSTADLVALGNNLLVLGAYLVIFPFQWWVTTAGLRAIVRHIETDDAEVGRMWAPTAETGWVIAYRVLYNLVVGLVLGIAFAPFAVLGAALVWQGTMVGGVVVAAIGLVVLIALSLWIALPLSLGTLACAIDGVSAFDAFPIAWQAGQGSRATLFVFGLAFGVLLIVGLCLFCVGQIPVYSMGVGAVAGGWYLYSRPLETLRASAFLQRNLPDLVAE